MEITTERRHDPQLRAVIDQAIEFKKSIGKSSAISFLVEHHVPPPLLERVLMQPMQPMQPSELQPKP